MQRYQLPPHVFVAVTEEGAVLLDLERDDYIGLDREQSRALATVVDEWPALSSESNATDEHPTPPRGDEVEAFAADLCERGLLKVGVERAAAHHPLRRMPLPATSELIAWEHMSAASVHGSHVVVFMMSLLRTLIAQRVLRFSRLVARVHNRKARVELARRPRASLSGREVSASRDGDTRSDFSEPSRSSALDAHVSAYFHIRPFFFGAKSRCLLDSLTLLEFLAHYGFYPDWVIGVQINPFGSHSWLQQDDLVINGTPSVVRSYNPILVV